MKKINILLVLIICFAALAAFKYETVNAAANLTVTLQGISNGYINYNTDSFTFAFSETIESGGTGTITLTNNKTDKKTTLTYSSGYGSKSLVYTIKDAAKLEQGESYTISVSGFNAGNGSSMPSAYSISFTSTWIPLVSSNGLNPYNFASDVSLTENLKIVFAKPVIKGIGYIYIYEASDNSLFQSVSVSTDNVIISKNTVEIKHNSFTPLTTYYVFVDPNAFYDAEFTSLSFSGINKIYDWTFKTLNIDTSLPLQSVSPKNSSDSIEIDTPLTIKFSKPVTIGSGYARIFDSSDSPFEYIEANNITISNDGLTATIPHKNFDYSTSYYISIDEGLFVSADKSTAYKGLLNDWGFTTEKHSLILNGVNISADKINISKSNQIYDINLTENKSSGELIIPASLFDDFKSFYDFILRISSFTITMDIGHDFGDIIGIDVILADNKLQLKEVGYRISSRQYHETSALQKRVLEMYPDSQILAMTACIKIEVIRLSDLKTVKTINNFENPYSRSINISKSSSLKLGEYYSTFFYNKSTNKLCFVPHTQYDNGSSQYIEISARENGVFIVINNEINFTDTKGIWSWCEPFVKIASAKGVISGIGNNLYSPQTYETRGQFAQMIANAMNLPSAAADTKEYIDVSKDAWYYDAVMRLRSAGFLMRFNEPEFHPNQPITREEMAVILSFAVQYTSKFVTAEYIDLNKSYTDYSEMNSKYIGDIQTVVKLKIMRGVSETEFDPKSYANRAQAATVIVNAMKAMNMID